MSWFSGPSCSSLGPTRNVQTRVSGRGNSSDDRAVTHLDEAHSTQHTVGGHKDEVEVRPSSDQFQESKTEVRSMKRKVEERSFLGHRDGLAVS